MKQVVKLLLLTAVFASLSLAFERDAAGQLVCFDPRPDHELPQCRFPFPYDDVITNFEVQCPPIGAVRLTSRRNLNRVRAEEGAFIYELQVNGEIFSSDVNTFINRAFSQFYTLVRLESVSCSYGDEFDLQLSFHLTRRLSLGPLTGGPYRERRAAFSFLIYTVTIKDGAVIYDHVREWLADDHAGPGELVLYEAYAQEHSFDDLPLRPRAAEDAP